MFCFQEIELQKGLTDWILENPHLCGECQFRPAVVKRKIDKYDVECYYTYEGPLRTLMLRYKEGGDKSLAIVIMWAIRFRIRTSTQGLIVLTVPSRIESQISRRFHHVEYLMDSIKIKSLCVFQNLAPDDQTMASNRSEIKAYIELTDIEMIRNKKVVIVDDIVSSGSTLRACMKLIHPYVKSVKGISISYSKHFIN